MVCLDAYIHTCAAIFLAFAARSLEELRFVPRLGMETTGHVPSGDKQFKNALCNEGKVVCCLLDPVGCT